MGVYYYICPKRLNRSRFVTDVDFPKQDVGFTFFLIRIKLRANVSYIIHYCGWYEDKIPYMYVFGW